MARLRDRPRKVARKPAFREPKRRLLVVCEGAVTEPEYIQAFAQHARGNLVDLQVVPAAGVPMTLVRVAADMRDRAEEDARREADDLLRYDETWCVFDVDEHPLVADSIEFARTHEMRTAVSNPCFELWLILHLRDSPGPEHRHRMQRILRKLMPGADPKHIDFDVLIGGYERAVERAGRLEPGRNPSTEMHLLTESIDSEGHIRRDEARGRRSRESRQKAQAAADRALEQANLELAEDPSLAGDRLDAEQSSDVSADVDPSTD